MELQDKPQESFLRYEADELIFVTPAENSRPEKKKSVAKLLNNYTGPLYCYDLDFIRYRAQKMQAVLKNVKLFYAMKANFNEEVLKIFLSLGVGIDVVSEGEIRKALSVGFTPDQIVYSGVGKTKKEIDSAIELSIYQINVESLPELRRIIEIAKNKKKKVNVAFRLNPNMSIETHPYIATGLRDNKFGIELEAFTELMAISKENKEFLNVRGISLHLGSQMKEFQPLKDALSKLRDYFIQLNKEFEECVCFDVGGGLGIFYEKQDLKAENQLLENYKEVIFSELEDLYKKIPNFEIQSEPGRWLVAHGGFLLSEVQYIKKTKFKNFLIIDSGMNHLLRPSLYEAYHEVMSVKNNEKKEIYDVVGPICESSDFFAKGRTLSTLNEGDFVLIADCGAYGASMSNDYNLQARAKEIYL
ncbi:MAG: diaminopimelate decarboxylase [Bdellovibrionaceae bacterium]|nr:diaminopimelate decarboxylase [Pseudobdellovibrionaceae bacterium]